MARCLPIESGAEHRRTISVTKPMTSGAVKHLSRLPIDSAPSWCRTTPTHCALGSPTSPMHSIPWLATLLRRTRHMGRADWHSVVPVVPVVSYAVNARGYLIFPHPKFHFARTSCALQNHVNHGNHVFGGWLGPVTLRIFKQ
jgi:hypothetical protein